MLDYLLLFISFVTMSHGYYSCPGGLSSALGMGGMGGMYGGRPCGQESIFHHYRCCDYNQYDCCVELETWFIIFLVLAGIVCLGCCCVCIGGAIFGIRRASD